MCDGVDSNHVILVPYCLNCYYTHIKCTTTAHIYTHMHNIRTADYISQHIPYKFHSLCAGEAAHLSSDFRRICETYFPHAELAQIIARQHTGTPQAQHRVSMVKAAQ